MNIKIRYATIDDYIDISKMLDKLHKIHFEARKDVYKKSYGILSKNEYINKLNNKNIKIIVAIHHNKIVGYALVNIINVSENLIIKSNKYIYIDELYILSNYRKNGIGNMIFKQIKKIAFNEECISIQLNVWSFNNVAMKFYDDIGFQIRNIRLEYEVNRFGA